MNPLSRFLGGLALACALASPAGAATITQTTSDSLSTDDSFLLGAHWGDGLAPNAASDYFSSTQLRTPGTAGGYTFAGKSLTLSLGSTLAYKGGGTGDTITVTDLRMGGGALSNWSSPAGVTFAGSILLNVGSDAAHTGGLLNINGGFGFTVSSAISGTGGLGVTYNGASSQSASAVVLSHASNTYSGGTTVSSFAYLDAQADGALGTGNVTLNGGQLKLEMGATSNYIADSAKLILASTLANGAVNLAFTGTDNIAGLSFDGGTTLAAAGTWGSLTSGAQNTSALFTGTGMLNVVPEVPTTALLVGGGALLLVVRVARRRAALA